MRIATIVEPSGMVAAVVRDELVLPLDLPDPELRSVRGIAGGGPSALGLVRAWVGAQPTRAWRRLSDVTLGPAVPDPGAVYTIGLNYRSPGEPPGARPDRPLVYGKAATSVGAPGGHLTWDRSVTDDVDAEVELGIVVGRTARDVAPEDALRHVLGYTIVDDVSARDPHLDGDQWLLGKSLPGFCPVGPWVVTADELDPTDLRLGCTIGGEAIQDGRTSDMRFGVADIVSFLSRHLVLRPGDLIATGTPARLASPPGPGRRLRPGDEVTAWIDGIGELTTRIG
jgi:2-keto-4-pentenoate hydratase/2-oxohepta-3-ene-1,7-dioic acid hydratase in catechol pathway